MGMDSLYKNYNKFEVCSYVNDPVCMAIIMNCNNYESGHEGEIVPTVNLGSHYVDLNVMTKYTVVPKYCAFLDSNNCPNIGDYFESIGLAKPYKTPWNQSVTKMSGWCNYKLYQFDKDKLIELGADVSEYEASYDKAFADMQKDFDDSFDYDKYSDMHVASCGEDNVGMALMMQCVDDDMDRMIITKDFGSFTDNRPIYCSTIMPMYSAFIDTNKYPGIDIYLMYNGIAQPYTRFGEVVTMSGFPLFEFNREKLKELGVKGMSKYEETYKKGFPVVQKRMRDAMYGSELEIDSLLDDDTCDIPD